MSLTAMKTIFLSLSVLLLAQAWAGAAALKVATLHPLLADLARQVGGERVEVVEILKPGSDIHHFEPASKDLATIRGAKLLLASGKQLESFLDKLRDSLGTNVKILEVGETIPSIAIADDHEGHDHEHDHDHDHHHGTFDPHWWHSAENMKRAARILAEEFATMDPANEDAYKAASKVAGKQFDQLKSWAQKQITQIPKKDRKLVTAHAAFGYFCKEYGFEPISILSIGRSEDISSKRLAQTIQTIRDNKIPAVFPEDQANPKVLAEIVRSTGVRLGKPLIADGTALEAHTYEAMLRHNVTVIVEALKPQAQ